LRACGHFPRAEFRDGAAPPGPPGPGWEGILAGGGGRFKENPFEQPISPDDTVHGRV